MNTMKLASFIHSTRKLNIHGNDFDGKSSSEEGEYILTSGLKQQMEHIAPNTTRSVLVKAQYTVHLNGKKSTAPAKELEIINFGWRCQSMLVEGMRVTMLVNSYIRNLDSIGEN